jgi:hypothetical protein
MGHINHVVALDSQAAVSAFLSISGKIGRQRNALTNSPFFMNSKQLET